MHTCLVPDIRGKDFSFSSFSMMLAMSLSYIAFITLTYVPSIKFVESFHHKWMLNFVKCFSYFYWDQHMIFILYFVYVVYHSDCLAHVEPSLYPWDKSHLIMVYNLFLCIVEFGLLVFYWGFLHLCSVGILACNLLFLWLPCLVLVSR